MSSFAVTPRTRLQRCAEKADYDRSSVYAILDAIPECTIAFCDPGSGLPRQMVSSHWRVGDALYIHGGRGSRFCRVLASGVPVSLSVAATDGLILARSAFETSVQYRSVMAYGCFSVIDDPAQQRMLFEAFYEHLLPGRWREIRAPSPQELAATFLLCLPLTEAVAKVSTGWPDDKEEDLQTPSWGGVRRYLHGWERFEADPLSADLPLPASVSDADRGQSGLPASGANGA